MDPNFPTHAPGIYREYYMDVMWKILLHIQRHLILLLDDNKVVRFSSLLKQHKATESSRRIICLRPQEKQSVLYGSKLQRLKKPENPFQHMGAVGWNKEDIASLYYSTTVTTSTRKAQAARFSGVSSPQASAGFN